MVEREKKSTVLTTYLNAVPAFDALVAADAWETGDGALGRPVVFCDKAVYAVGAGECC